MISAGGPRNRQESGDIGRRLVESAGDRSYRQEVHGIGGRSMISPGGSRNQRESGDIGRRSAESAGDR
ncbi:hypothetical protein ACFOGI_09145 [Virgibacillus xinjiangensis]|uniref:Uncharacterized protein n=1 Tax=Virgibacillus xinjiangensis TaxID=393090 RepID=A0ABV7CVU7_9BACI